MLFSSWCRRGEKPLSLQRRTIMSKTFEANRSLKRYEGLAGEICNPNALRCDFAGLGESCDQRFLKEQAGLKGRGSIGGRRPREADVDLPAVEGDILSMRHIFDKTQCYSGMTSLVFPNEIGKEEGS